VASKDWKDDLDRDFPEVGSITAKMVDDVRAQCHRLRGSVRLMMGLLESTEDHERRRQQMRAMPL